MQDLELIAKALNSVSFKDFFLGFLLGLSISGAFVWKFLNFIQKLYKNTQEDLKEEIKALKAEREAFRIELLKQQNMNMIGEVFKK
ncbi:hypothetical protein DMB92_05325 [Campylobacter sp. MIT 99-7217]|uniref:hypothetical protein n=1 Tax=Campylobacter sp. MIT 99-7217 TaxID=535091 RepID=UPI0011591B47|nr:hypothetical protein [Campylobacter sp. MIT 99-7217]TQR31810.1 hypothetical protein DMB92_05325 [Campylobacter sp. MIT 99-7217]